MSINEQIRAAVLPVVPVCVPDLYAGEEDVYCTFSYSELPAAIGDDEPHAVRHLIQLHLHLPLSSNALALKRSVRRALLDADFSAPTVTSATDETGQHYIFEFEGIGGDI